MKKPVDGTVHFVFAALLSLFVTSAVHAQLPDFTELAAEAAPAVVNISTTQKVKSSMRLPRGLEIPDLPEGHPLNEFFRRFFGENGRGGHGGNGDDSGDSESFDTSSLGSGFIISKDGFIITNHHVVKDADEIIVRLSDRRQFTAEVIGTDPRSDIALLKVDADNLPVVKVGKSDQLKVGEWVMAIGSPFGFDHSVTAGIVSAKGRSLPSGNYVPFIQTDVAINPGNSGGPLLNLKGEVVGVNAQIYSRSGGFMGLSFSIPMDVAMDVVEQLRNKGRVSRGWLGVLIQDVTGELADSFGMDKPEGALVAQVLEDSPAEKAGLQVGDIILRFSGKEVPDSSSLPPIVGRTKVGKTVDVEVLRNGKKQTIPLKIGKLPPDDQLQASAKGVRGDRTGRLGVAVTNLTDEQREALEIPEGGVLVEEVLDGPAKRAGIRANDVILMINGQDVKDVAGFKQQVKDLPKDKPVAVLVHRKGGPIFLAMKMGE